MLQSKLFRATKDDRSICYYASNSSAKIYSDNLLSLAFIGDVMLLPDSSQGYYCLFLVDLDGHNYRYYGAGMMKDVLKAVDYKFKYVSRMEIIHVV